MADIDFDAVLSQIGERGRYQNRLYFMLCIPAALPAVFLAFNQVFVSATPAHWCRVPELDTMLGPEDVRAAAVPFTLLSDGSREYSRCEMYDVNFTALLLQGIVGAALEPDSSWNRTACRNGWHYDRTNYDETLVTELDLVCDKSWWTATSTTCFCIGSLIGNVLCGIIGDRLGRRPAFLCTVCWHVVFSIATAFSPDYFTYTILRSLNALVFPAIFQVPFVLALELMGPKQRTYAGMMVCVFFSMALMLLALLTLVLRDWFSLLVATSTPFVFLLGYYWIIPESPRWLLSKNRVAEAEVIVQRMAKVNGHPVPPNFLQNIQRERAKLTPAPPPRDEKMNATPLDMMKRPLLRRTFLIITLDWVANAVVYSGLNYNSGNLGVSDQKAFMLGAMVELFSVLCSWWAMDRWGRRAIVCGSMLFGGLACVSCGLVPDGAVWATVTLAMVGRFGISASYAVFYVFVGELLPTVVRSQSMALGSFVANFGLLGFPSIVHLAVYNRVLPLLVFGALSLSGALASAMLPETLGLPLPQTLDDGETMHKKSRQMHQEQTMCSCLPGKRAGLI